MLVSTLLLTVILLLLFFEKFLIQKSINKIPVRILVNGTRGKSSVVKYISMLLRNNNRKTFSKITGVVPIYYSHDGKPSIIKRRGGARVTEQFRLIRKAAKLRSDAIVLECMSINPELQKVESDVLKPDYYIITNIREDHLEEMGQSEEERVEAICSAIPNNCKVLTAERKYLSLIQEYASKRNSTVVSVEKLNENIEIRDRNIHPDNIRLTLLLVKELNLQSEEFIKTINEEHVEDNVLSTVINKKEVKFYNAFSINDVPSAELFYEENRDVLRNGKFVVIFNSRADRPFRSILFSKWFAELKECSYFILTGDHVGRTKMEMIKNGIPKNKILRWGKTEAGNPVKSISNLIIEDTSVIGVGNIKSLGFEIVKGFKSAMVTE
jgi:gamma-polyglutamate synthase